MSQQSFALSKFDNTLGSLLIGGLVAMALWGVTCVQTYTYFTRSSRDMPYFKLMIAFLWALDTFDSILNVHILYYYMVSNYLNPLALLVPVWSVIIHVAITSASNYIIRTMFALRVWRLSKKNLPLTLWITMISTTDLVVGLVITIKAFKLSSFAELSSLSSLMYLNFASGTGSDISLALALCFLLYQSRTGFPKTDSLIDVLMLYTVNTGMIVAIDASLGMIMYIVMPRNFIFLGFYLLLSKLYLNSYLATLNAREGLREQSEEHVSIHISQLSQSRYGTSPTVSAGKPSRDEPLAISVDTLVDKDLDTQRGTIRSGAMIGVGQWKVDRHTGDRRHVSSVPTFTREGNTSSGTDTEAGEDMKMVIDEVEEGDGREWTALKGEWSYGGNGDEEKGRGVVVARVL